MMLSDIYMQTLKDAINRWGKKWQLILAMEEFGELMSAISQHYRGRKNRLMVCEEIADAQIMLDTLKIIHGYDDVDTWITVKIVELQERIDEEE